MSCQAWVASGLKLPQFTPPATFQNILGHKEGMLSWDGDVAVSDFYHFASLHVTSSMLLQCLLFK